eukprot:9641466-Alexandrium_andersonii.AAC.1
MAKEDALVFGPRCESLRRNAKLFGAGMRVRAYLHMCICQVWGPSGWKFLGVARGPELPVLAHSMLTSLEVVWSLRPRLRPGRLRPPPAGKPATGFAAGACDRN